MGFLSILRSLLTSPSYYRTRALLAKADEVIAQHRELAADIKSAIEDDGPDPLKSFLKLLEAARTRKRAARGRHEQ